MRSCCAGEASAILAGSTVAGLLQALATPIERSAPSANCPGMRFRVVILAKRCRSPFRDRALDPLESSILPRRERLREHVEVALRLIRVATSEVEQRLSEVVASPDVKR